MSHAYDEHCYSSEIVGRYVSEDDFRYVLMSLNLTLSQFWPCDVAIFLAYVLVPFSFGFSLLLPQLCIGDAKNAMQ